MAKLTIPGTINVTPDLAALLWREHSGQGGYQNRIRKIQTQLGIQPNGDANQMTVQDIGACIVRGATVPSTPIITAPATVDTAAMPITPSADVASIVAAILAGQQTTAADVTARLEAKRKAIEAAQAEMQTLERLAVALTPATPALNASAVDDAAADVSEQAPARRRSVAKRRNAQRRRWEGMSAAERKRQIAKMQAGRAR